MKYLNFAYKKIAVFLILLSVQNVFAAAVSARAIAEDNTSFNTKTIFFPIAFYTPETSLGAGAAVMTLFGAGRAKGADYSSLNLFGMYSLNNEYALGIVPEYVTKNENYTFQIAARLRNSTEKFYGIGNESDVDDEEKFSMKEASLSATVYRKIFKNFRAGITARYGAFNVYDEKSGGILNNAHIAGTANSAMAGAGVKLSYSDCRKVFAPKNGTRFDAEYIYHSKSAGDYEFSYIKADFRKYLPLSEKYTVSCQILGEFISGTAPFEFLPQLGGQSLLRGMPRGRYRDNILLAFQPELKRKISNVVTGIIFAGVGNVYDNLEKVDLGYLHVTGGVGARIRIIKNPEINLRIDVGFAEDSQGTYIGIMEAF
jgi:hypothetical protein